MVKHTRYVYGTLPPPPFVASFSDFPHLRLYSQFQTPLPNVKSVSGFCYVDDVVASFIGFIKNRPLPSVVEINKILGFIVNTKHCLTAISLFAQIGFRGITPSIVTLNILINCCCHLGYMGFAFSVLRKIIKRGYEFNLITLNAIMKGLCINGDGEVRKALEFHDYVRPLGFKLNEELAM